MLRGVGERPVLAVLVGAVAIAFSGILFRLSHVSASTGAFYRCVFALPPLWLLARRETHRYGRPARRAVRLGRAPGVGDPRGKAAAVVAHGDPDRRVRRAADLRRARERGLR